MGRRVSLHLEENVLQDLMMFTRESRPSRAICKAIDAYMDQYRKEKVEDLRQMMGTIDLEDNWYESRHGHTKEEEEWLQRRREAGKQD